MRTSWFPLLAAAGVWIAGPAGFAGDWPNYRGPTHDGTSTEVIRTNWTAVAPRQMWKVSVGAALSSMTVKDGRVFTMERHGDTISGREFCIALDAESGEKLWETDIGVADYPHGGVGQDDGPRSTPTVFGDHVFVLGSYLSLACLNSADGSVVWSRDLRSEYGAEVIWWQSAASPLVLGDLVFVATAAPTNRLFAFHRDSGQLAWRRHDEGMTHATPVPAQIHGVQQVVFLTHTGLVSVDPGSGDVFWRFPFGITTSVAASPVIDGNYVYCSASYGRGAAVGAVSHDGGTFSAADVWRKPGDHQNHWGTPVVHEGFLYGPYGQSNPSLECIELATGVSKWIEPGMGYGSVLRVGGLLLVLHSNGTVVLVNPTPDGYSEIDRFRPLIGKCWNNAAISDGRLYVRSTLEAAAFDISLPVPRFASPAGSMTPFGFRLTITSSDASPIGPERAGSISVFHAPDPGTPPLDWSLLNGSFTFEDGNLIVTDPDALAAPNRFYRAAESR